MLRTHLTTRLGLRYPLIGAPMANLAGGELARAITEAGGLGMIGVGSRDSPEFVEREASLVRRDSAAIRFGIGLMAWDLVNRPQVLDAVIAAHPFLVSVSFGAIEPYVAPLHEAGILVASQVHDSTEAITATGAGVDLVVVQGGEAGGHTGSVSTLALLQVVLQATSLPVVAAGGIATPAGMAACLAAGAEGAWVGTAFIASPECRRRPAAISAILAACETDTVRTHAFDQAQGIPWPERFPGRALRNDFTERWHGREGQMAEDLAAQVEYRSACQHGDYNLAHIYAGQAVGLVRSVQPAGDVLREIAEGAEALLRVRFAQVLA